MSFQINEAGQTCENIVNCHLKMEILAMEFQ